MFKLLVSVREEHWTGLGLDWTVANLIEFGLDPEC